MTTSIAQPSQTKQPQHVDPAKKRPKVLIAGGGLGGLSLGMLLQQTDIPYEIFERATEPKALGNLGAIGHVIARPALHDLLFRQIPKERIHMGKKILSTDDQGDNGITVTFSDGTTASGDILIGADGAYSAVRQNLFKRLKAHNKLPAADDVPLPYSTVCLVGQTRPLDPAVFPHLLQDDCQFINTLGENKPWAGTVCWSIIRFVEESKTSTDDKNHHSTVDQEWGPEAAEAMCNEVRHFPVMSGNEANPLTLGDLIDHTPKDLISKVKLEEIVFETWFGGRTVLMGDACHKLNPAGGVGCQNAMHDAIILANWINALPSDPNSKDIENAFRSYQDERLPWIQTASNSTRFYRTMASGGIMAGLLRFCAKYMPAWAKRKMLVVLGGNRPQCSFLPLVEDKGSVPPAFQPSLLATKPKTSATSV
ncbi:hypothetical protein BGX30_014731 [Mortierella sp. GBA39]|nr:hypothetical protein BGX30_014731 [Mortierella sp. GBA39]